MADLSQYTATSATTGSSDPVTKVDEDRSSTSAQTLGTAHKTTAKSLTQQDFDVAIEFSNQGANLILQQPTALQNADRQPWDGADKAASNPYGDIIDSLRKAALRRDAAAATSAPAPKSDDATTSTSSGPTSTPAAASAAR